MAKESEGEHEGRIALDEAIGHEAEGRASQAVEAYLAVADKLLSSKRAMGVVESNAVLAYAAALAARSPEVDRDAKLRIAERVRESDLSERLARTREHRAPCTDCGREKAAAWVRCPACGALPTLEEEVVSSLLRSRRIRAVDAQGGVQLDGRALTYLERSLVQALSHALNPPWRGASARGSDRSIDHREPGHGTLMTAVSEDRRSGVLVDFDLPLPLSPFGDEATSVLLQDYCRELLRHDDINDLGLLRRKRELEKRGGGEIRVVSFKRVHVSRGSVATREMGVVSQNPNRSKEGLLQAIGAAAIVALDVDGVPTEVVDDFARQVADHLLHSRLFSRQGDEDAKTESLVREPFWYESSATIAEALDVVAEVAGATVRIADWAYRVRLQPDDDGPHRFPSEAAKRA